MPKNLIFKKEDIIKRVSKLLDSITAESGSFEQEQAQEIIKLLKTFL